MHGHFDLTALAIIAAVASLFGLICTRFRQPALIGFIFSGVVLGPFGFHILQNDDGVRFIAELGLLLLLFVIGLEVSVRSLRRWLRVVFLTALFQVAASLAIVFAIGAAMDWPLSRTLVIGFSLSLASTAIGVKLLEGAGQARREPGRVTVGVLIAQDLLLIPMLIIVGAAGHDGGFEPITVVKIVLAALGIAGLVFVLSRTEKIKLPLTEVIRDSLDAGPLAAMAFCLCCAAAASAAGISAAYGAFIAGLILSASTARHEALQIIVPIQSILLMTFFLSIGMLLDVRVLIEHAMAIALLLAAVLIGKTAINVIALRILGVPARSAIISAFSMAQMGEFAFVLCATGLASGSIDETSYQIIVAVVTLSMAASPLWMIAIRRIVAMEETGSATVQGLIGDVFAPETARMERFTRRTLGRAVDQTWGKVSGSRGAFFSRRTRSQKPSAQGELDVDGV